jgi:hypothetical protein
MKPCPLRIAAAALGASRRMNGQQRPPRIALRAHNPQPCQRPPNQHAQPTANPGPARSAGGVAALIGASSLSWVQARPFLAWDWAGGLSCCKMVHVSPLPVGQHCVQRAALPCTALPSLLPSLTRAACRLPFFLPFLLWCALVLSFLSAALLARCILCLTLRVGPDRRDIQPERDAGIDVYSFIISQRWLRCLLDRRNLHGWPYLLGAVHPVSCVRRRPP